MRDVTNVGVNFTPVDARIVGRMKANAETIVNMEVNAFIFNLTLKYVVAKLVAFKMP